MADAGDATAAAGAFRPVAADIETLPLREHAFDVVLARHVVWALKSPDLSLARWVGLLRPGGVLVLVEGRWSTGAGITAPELVALVRRHRHEAEVTALPDPRLWGKPVTDERYLVVSRS